LTSKKLHLRGSLEAYQFLFITRFWADDSSDGFEKSDEAIEKGVNLTFDLMARSPLDSLVDYGKFIARNVHLKA
jgi:Tetracyclin repressor-like, C-terminal domain